MAGSRGPPWLCWWPLPVPRPAWVRFARLAGSKERRRGCGGSFRHQCCATTRTGTRHSLVQKRCHLGIAGAGGTPTQHDADYAAAIIVDGADQIEAAGIGIAGLDAVHALYSDTLGCCAHEWCGRETRRRAWKTGGIPAENYGPARDRDAPCLARSSPVGYRAGRNHCETPCGSCQLAGLGCHGCREFLFRTIEMVANAFSHVIGGFDDHAQNSFAHRIGFALFQSKLGGRGACAIG